MSDHRWFTAVVRPARDAHPAGVDLQRRPARVDEHDPWADAGCDYCMTVADAVALRDSLNEAIREAVAGPPTSCPRLGAPCPRPGVLDRPTGPLGTDGNEYEPDPGDACQ